MTLKEQIIELLARQEGLSDREITDELRGKQAHQQPINAACNDLEKRGQLVRKKRPDGITGNYLTNACPPAGPEPPPSEDGHTEDDLKRCLESWLQGQGWSVKIAWARERGVDIAATKDSMPPLVHRS